MAKENKGLTYKELLEAYAGKYVCCEIVHRGANGIAKRFEPLEATNNKSEAFLLLEAYDLVEDHEFILVPAFDSENTIIITVGENDDNVILSLTCAETADFFRRFYGRR